jgi:hypothetical protein
MIELSFYVRGMGGLLWRLSVSDLKMRNGRVLVRGTRGIGRFEV